MNNKVHVKTGDEVIVINGKNRGMKGKVLQVSPAEGKVIVEGVNRVTKHVKAGQSARGSRTGGLVHTEAPIHVSNVMVIDSDGKPTRIGYRIDEQSGKKVRISKRNGKDI